MPEQAVRAVDCACRGSYCHGLVNLDRRRVILVGGLLVLQSFAQFSFPFDFVLVYSMRLDYLSLPCLLLPDLSFAIDARLIWSWAM